VSGVYTLSIGEESIEVFCDMTTDGGGWTVLQQRGDNGNPEDFFYRDWADYEQGFGDPEKDYWVGLKYWNIITQSEDVQMLISLQEFDNDKIEASYTNFKISDSSDKYRMTFTAAETKYDSLSYSKGGQFTTRDDDNDEWSHGNCAKDRKGAWWYRRVGWWNGGEWCGPSNLNGLYKKGVKDDSETVYWREWRGQDESLKTTKMMVRKMKRKYNLPSKYIRPSECKEEWTWTCCTSQYKCGEGEGDCDGDWDCKPGLRCGRFNCRGFASYFPSSASCCYKP